MIGGRVLGLIGFGSIVYALVHLPWAVSMLIGGILLMVFAGQLLTEGRR